MTETQQRFLRAIAARVPRDQVVEVHLFPPIRQGGVETGVAVVAEDPRRKSATEPFDASVPAPDVTSADASSNGAAPDVAAGPAAIPMDAGDALADEESAAEVDAVDAAVASDSASEREAANGAAPAPRFTIHTARYRLTLKGVDRGKWDFDLVAEADAPLEAVDKVVRGVQRRAGEGTDPDRLTSESFLEALDAPLSQLER